MDENAFTRLDRALVGRPESRKLIDEHVARALASLGEAPSLTRVLSLDFLGNGIPSEIRLCRLYILRRNTRAPRERHPNSVQTVLSYRGRGAIHVERNGSWCTDFVSRWHVVPANTWHSPEAFEDDWVTLAFHSASEREIVDEVLTAPTA